MSSLRVQRFQSRNFDPRAGGRESQLLRHARMPLPWLQQRLRGPALVWEDGTKVYQHVAIRVLHSSTPESP